MFFERLGKSRRRLIANAGRNPGDGVVARFEHECGLIHPMRDEVMVHGLADKPGKASREGRAAEPHMAPERAKGPWVFGAFVDQLKRLADVPIRNCTEPPAFVRTKGFNPTAQHLDKEHLGHSREYGELAGTLDRRLGHHPLQDCLESPRASSAGPVVAISAGCSVMGARG
jgi:hypothetical protein